MTDTIETVRVVAPGSSENPHGYIVINLDDLTADHTIFDDAPKSTKLTLPAPKTQSKD